MNERASLGARVGRFAALIGGIGTLVAVIIITQRLSQDSLALLVGLSCGVAAMTPTIGLGLLLWRRELRRQVRAPAPHPQAATPPVVVVTPQALPQAHQRGQSTPNWSWEAAAAKRNFTIVGGEE